MGEEQLARPPPAKYLDEDGEIMTDANLFNKSMPHIAEEEEFSQSEAEAETATVVTSARSGTSSIGFANQFSREEIEGAAQHFAEGILDKRVPQKEIIPQQRPRESMLAKKYWMNTIRSMPLFTRCIVQ